MSSIVPVEYITTDEALKALADADAEHKRLTDEWQNACGGGKAAAWAEMGDRATALQQAVSGSILAGNLAAYVLGDGFRCLRLPQDHWREIRGDVSLVRGKVIGTEGQYEGLPLCFSVGDWQRWLHAWPFGLWTFTEAAVWVRTRDLKIVQSLDARQRASLTITSNRFDGAMIAAHKNLLPAIQAHRVRAWVQVAGGHHQMPVSLWKDADGNDLALDLREVWANDEPSGVAMKAGENHSVGPVFVSAYDCQVCFPTPASVLDGGGMLLGDFMDRLERFDSPQLFVQLPGVFVSGLDVGGQRVPIDRTVLASASWNVEGNTLSCDGFVWRAVTVEAKTEPAATVATDRAAEAPTAETPALAPSVKAEIDNAIVAWVRPIIDLIVNDGKQLKRDQFNKMVWGKFGAATELNCDDVWKEVAGPWRTETSGRLPGRKTVSDYDTYVVAAHGKEWRTK